MDQNTSRIVAAVSYFSWIGWVIALVVRNPEDDFVKLHLNQALALNILGTVLGIVGRILAVIPVIRLVGGLAVGAAGLAIAIIGIMGVIRAVTWNDKPLPVVGGIKLI